VVTTVKIAEAVARGAAAVNGARVELVTADEAPGRWELLDNSDAVIMGAHTCVGSPKPFFPRLLKYGLSRYLPLRNRAS
jgi:hypothetical protein